MRYLYVYEYSRQLCSILGGGETGFKFKLYFSSEPEVTVGACPDKVEVVIKPIARIPVEDLQAEQKREETNQKISELNKQIKELQNKKKELKDGLDE